MKRIYLVAEGETDRIVLPELLENWFGEFILTIIKFPSSAYADGLETNLSGGWRGVLAWCGGISMVSQTGRDQAIQNADCLIIHVDADVAFDLNFKSPPFDGPFPPARNVCDWVREHLIATLGGNLPPNVVLCVPAQDLEAWILCALHPDVADQYMPIECRREPAALLVQRVPHQLVRRKTTKSKNGRSKSALRKYPDLYQKSLPDIIEGWPDCLSRCPEAARFETDAKQVLRVTG